MTRLRPESSGARWNTQAGQSLVVTAFAMTALLGMLGFGIDFGYLRYSKRQLQSLADAAAIAAALQIPTCGASPGCSSLTTAAETSLEENGVSATHLSTNSNCSNTAGAGATIIVVNNPPSCLAKGTTFPTNDPNNGNNNFAEVMVFQNEPTFFSRIFGVNSMQMAARAEAETSSGSNCEYALDPSANGAITLILGVVANQCGVVDESSSGSAFSCLFGSFQAPYIGVHGGDGIPLCLFPGATPKTRINDPTPTDPLQYLQADLKSEAPGTATSNCPTGAGSGSGSLLNGTYTGAKAAISITNHTVTLNPGTYCGGITIGVGAHVTFNSGIYTITSTTSTGASVPGGLSIDAGTTVTGNGVGFYNYGPNGGVNFLCSSCTAGGVTLTAPNSSNCGSCGAAWQGMLFYQDPGDTAQSTVVGSASFNTTPTGTSYFPSATVLYAFDATVNYNILVAKDITLGLTWSGNNIDTKFFNNYTELNNGSPIKGGAAVVE
jgi:hypothetical protein